jgi:thiamine biosynthesis lipoprotein
MKSFERLSCWLLILSFSSCACHRAAPPQENTISGTTMSTTYQVKIARDFLAARDLPVVKEKIDSALIAVNRQMSAFDPQSEISRFNACNDTLPFTVSVPLHDVVQVALEVYRQSSGYFDITVAPLVDLWGFGKMNRRSEPPGEQQIARVRKHVGSAHLIIADSTHLRKTIPELELDLSAIAKGYGVDVVAELLDSLRYKNFLVEIGGEIVARGLNAKNELWKIAVEQPQFASLPGEQVMSILALSNVGVATSGDYRNYFEYQGRKYSHTIDPFTGYPVRHDLASVTVIAGNCTRADALATAVMAMGPQQGLPWIENMSAVEALLIVRLPDGKYKEFQTAGFNKYLTVKDKHE